ncbi:hypothetical protein JHK87_000932 [Glycine soja]|nr:hypothetical protein JHK87_000932 [Glycine soja]
MERLTVYFIDMLQGLLEGFEGVHIHRDDHHHHHQNDTLTTFQLLHDMIQSNIVNKNPPNLASDCFSSNLISAFQLHVPQPNQDPAFSFSGVQRLSPVLVEEAHFTCSLTILLVFIFISWFLLHFHSSVYRGCQFCWLKNLTSLGKAHKIVAQIKNVDPGKWNDVVKVEMKYDFTLFDDVFTSSANPDYLIDPSELSLVTCSQRLSQISYSSQITSEDRFVYNAQVKSLNELCEFDPKDIPEAIDRILGKKFAFRFKGMLNNTQYPVSQISEDEDLIMLLLKRLPTYELVEIEPEMLDLSMKQRDDISYTAHVSKLWKIVDNVNESAIGRFEMILFDSQNVSVLRNDVELRLTNHEYKLEITRFFVVTSMGSKSLTQICCLKPVPIEAITESFEIPAYCIGILLSVFSVMNMSKL